MTDFSPLVFEECPQFAVFFAKSFIAFGPMTGLDNGIFCCVLGSILSEPCEAPFVQLGLQGGELLLQAGKLPVNVSERLTRIGMVGTLFGLPMLFTDFEMPGELGGSSSQLMGVILPARLLEMTGRLPQMLNLSLDRFRITMLAQSTDRPSLASVPFSSFAFAASLCWPALWVLSGFTLGIVVSFDVAFPLFLNLSFASLSFASLSFATFLSFGSLPSGAIPFGGRVFLVGFLSNN